MARPGAAGAARDDAGRRAASAPATPPGWSASGTWAPSTRATTPCAAASTRRSASAAACTTTTTGGWSSASQVRAGRWPLPDRCLDRGGGRASSSATSRRAVLPARHLQRAAHAAAGAGGGGAAVPARRGSSTWGVSTLYGMIHRMDRGVARILETLHRHGLAENTIVIFTSDNGPQFGGAGRATAPRASTASFNGAKGTVYEGGIRVPDARCAGRPVCTAGGRCDRDGALHRLVPHAAGAGGRARSLPGLTARRRERAAAAARRGGPRSCTRRFWQWNRYTPLVDLQRRHARRRLEAGAARPSARPWRCPTSSWLAGLDVRAGAFHRTTASSAIPIRRAEVPPPPPPELYNIAADPLEQHNLAERASGDASARMLRELETWFEEVEAERATIHDN